MPYINLRLPDVLGPFDNTNRYWCLLEWIKQSKKHPLEVNAKDKLSKLSFVYSKDVAQLIHNLIATRESVDKYRSYNIACKELVSYMELVEAIVLLLSRRANHCNLPCRSGTRMWMGRRAGAYTRRPTTHV